MEEPHQQQPSICFIQVVPSNTTGLLDFGESSIAILLNSRCALIRNLGHREYENIRDKNLNFLLPEIRY
jgi:hypothetical protein